MKPDLDGRQIYLPAGIALENVLEAVHALCEPIGVILHGSRVSGNHDSFSDIDAIVMVEGQPIKPLFRTMGAVGLDLMSGREEDFRKLLSEQTVSRTFEILINAAASDGVLVFDRNGSAQSFVDYSKSVWRKGPWPLTQKEMERFQTRAIRLLWSAERLVPRSLSDPSQALAGSLRCDHLIVEAVFAYFRKTGRWTASFPKLVKQLQKDGDKLGTWCLEYSSATVLATKLDIARRVYSQVFQGW